MKEELKVVSWKDNRYIIINKDGEIIDDAQGYGYKDKQKAHKALWWKFKKGKEKTSKNKSNFKKWLKNEENKKIFTEIKSNIEWNFKEIFRKEITIEEIIKSFEKKYDCQMPKFVKYELKN